MKYEICGYEKSEIKERKHEKALIKEQ